MAAAHSFLTPDRFEQLYSDDSKPYFEYWFGGAVQKSMPTIVHGVMQMVVCMLLIKRGWKAASEVRLKISKIAYPVPDVIANRTPFEGPYPTMPFDLCVEILSPRDKLPKLFEKCAHYLDWGIHSVWIIDPDKHDAYQMTLWNPQPKPVSLSGYLTAGPEEAQVIISLSEIFSETDKQLGKQHEAR